MKHMVSNYLLLRILLYLSFSPVFLKEHLCAKIYK